MVFLVKDIPPRAREKFSKLFTVEVWGSKGWEVVSTHTSWKKACEDAESFTFLFQTRVTSPEKE